MLKFDATVSGETALRAAMAYFERETRKRPIDGCRVAAAFCAGTLAKRTKVSKYGSEVAEASAEDIREIAMEHPGKLYMLQGANAEGFFKNVVQGKHGGAWVVRSDKPGRRYAAAWWFFKDESNDASLKIQYRHALRGLAKKSWFWLQSKSRRGGVGAQLPESAYGLADRAFSVYADTGAQAVVITNKLRYINVATPPAAVDEAMRAAANRLIGWTNSMLAKTLEKAGFSKDDAKKIARANQ